MPQDLINFLEELPYHASVKFLVKLFFKYMHSAFFSVRSHKCQEYGHKHTQCPQVRCQPEKEEKERPAQVVNNLYFNASLDTVKFQ